MFGLGLCEDEQGRPANVLLARYCSPRFLLTRVDVSALVETDVELIFAA